MDPEGKNVRKVSDIQLKDSWFNSRNEGSEFIVNPHKSVDSLFYIIDLNGKIINKVKTGLAYFNDPCFSPNGDQIVFRGANKKFKKDTGFIDELYILNVDGSGLKKLTNYPANDTTAEWFNYKAGPPKWNKKNNFITYQSKQNNSYSLFAINPDGGKQWKLTDNKQEEGWHSWSENGEWLAIELFDTEQTQFNIGLFNWYTKELKILTDSTYRYQQAPVFVEIVK